MGDDHLATEADDDEHLASEAEADGVDGGGAEGSVSKMVSSEGALAATNLGFPVGHFLAKLNVKVGDKVKKDQLLAVEGQSGPLEALIQSQQLLTSQQGELALILNDVTVPGDLRILEAAGTVAGDARRNIELKAKADDNTFRRARELLKIDEQAAEAALKKAQADGCGPNGPLTALPTAAETALCATDDAAVKAAELTVFNQRMTVITDEDNLRVDRGNLETTYAQDLVTVKTDENAYRIAATNRPSQIAIQQALYLADQAVVVTNVDPALKSGLTSNVSVVTSTIKNQALVVPSAAVTTQGGKSFVDTSGPDGKPQRVPFTPGKAGNDNTEVLSGLSKGQEVMLPPSGPLPRPRPHAAPAR